MENCIFCKIVNKEIPASIIYEDDNTLTFLDTNPASKGQTLVIPKKHDNYIFDISDQNYTNLFLASKKIAKAIDKSLNTIRTCIVVEGFLVDHIHIRLHPCYKKHLNLQPLEPKPTNKELEKIANKIKSNLE